MVEMGANCIRIYHNPPKWFLDLALFSGLKVFLDVAWPKNISFEGNHEVVDGGDGGELHSHLPQSTEMVFGFGAVFRTEGVSGCRLAEEHQLRGQPRGG